MIFYPRHLNQFIKPMGIPWPGDYNACNCWATVGAQQIRAATHGQHKPGPPRVRDLSGNEHCPGHIGYIAKAAEHYGVNYIIPHATSTGWGFGVPEEEVIARLNRDQFAAVALHYGTLPDEYRANTSFTGDHMFLVYPSRDSSPIVRSSTVYGSDPLRMHRKQYPLDVLFKAAERTAGDLRFPKGNIIAGFVQGVTR